MSEQYPRIWLLLGERNGDNSQLLALAEELGLPFETRSLHYNRLRAIAGKYLGATLLTLNRASKRRLRAPWPDLVIAIGRRSVPVARWIKRRSGGSARLVQLGNPRADPALFDLVITTPQYPVRAAPNVLVLPMAMSRFRSAPERNESEVAWLDALPRPHLLLAVGGSTSTLDLTAERVADAARQLVSRASARGGSLIIVGSPRTQPELIEAAENSLAAETPHILARDNMPRFQVLLADADEVHVTGDSVSMLSEAVLTGRPVGMIPVDLNAKARKWLGEGPPGEHFTGPKRDLRRVWVRLERDGLIGTIDAPRSRPVDNPVVAAAAALRGLLKR